MALEKLNRLLRQSQGTIWQWRFRRRVTGVLMKLKQEVTAILHLFVLSCQLGGCEATFDA